MLERGSSRRRVAGTGLALRTHALRAPRCGRSSAAPPARGPSCVAVLLLVGLVAWLGWFSTVLTASTVEVHGSRATASGRVRSVAEVPLGGPLMRVDTDAVTTRLLADRAWSSVVGEPEPPRTPSSSRSPRASRCSRSQP